MTLMFSAMGVPAEYIALLLRGTGLSIASAP
jgi:hypothetical protein